MLNLTQLCYMVFAPISVMSEFILIYAFIKLKQFKDHPEIMIFWQCFSQIILDIHWFTGIEFFKGMLNDEECLFLGAFSVYFYYLSWDYSLFLSVEILLKIWNPHKTTYKMRKILYHTLAHLTSLGVFVALMISQTNGNSIMTTCFVQEHSVYELIILIPALIHFPLCVAIIGYTLYISHNTYFAPYLTYHMMVVVAYSISWVPIALVHGLSYEGFHVTVPLWFIYVIITQMAVFLGGPSGFFVFLARMMQKGLFRKVILSIFRPGVLNRSLMVQLTAPDINSDQDEVMTYSQLFNTMTAYVIKNKGIKDIILAVRNVLISSSNPEITGQDYRKWRFSIGLAKKKVKIFQYHITSFESIMEYYGISYKDLINSFQIEDDMERLNARVKTSGGRSGAFFYFTADHEFVLKTITSEELHIFKSIIKDYKNHITDKQGSLLSKVFGVFKLKIDKSSTFRIVLMENLASRLIDPIIFDMKGSKSDRHASFSVYADINRMRRDKVYKDIDFSDNIGHISVTQEELNNLLSKLKRDAHLLEKHMIMDYSLLLMIENINCLRNTMINKTFVASYGKFIVFAGVIDFLQTYNTKKKLEHRYKKLKNQESIHFSSIAPTPYRKRFIRMVKNVFKREEIN